MVSIDIDGSKIKIMQRQGEKIEKINRYRYFFRSLKIKGKLPMT
jgi:hypothetical protein